MNGKGKKALVKAQRFIREQSQSSGPSCIDKQPKLIIIDSQPLAVNPVKHRMSIKSQDDD